MASEILLAVPVAAATLIHMHTITICLYFSAFSAVLFFLLTSAARQI